MKVRIRSFRVADRGMLSRFLEEEQDYLVSLDPYRDYHRPKGYGRAWSRQTLNSVRKNRGRILVAETTAGPVGFISAFVRPRNRLQMLDERPLKRGTIMDLYVVAEARGMGIGTALVRAAERHLTRNGCTRIDLGVFAPNRRARALYLSLGYRDRSIQLMKRVRRVR